MIKEDVTFLVPHLSYPKSSFIYDRSFPSFEVFLDIKDKNIGNHGYIDVSIL